MNFTEDIQGMRVRDTSDQSHLRSEAPRSEAHRSEAPQSEGPSVSGNFGQRELRSEGPSVRETFSAPLKDALAKLIVMENLPFALVESKYFIDVLALYDKRVKLNFPTADTIADHVVAKYNAAINERPFITTQLILMGKSNVSRHLTLAAQKILERK